MKTLYRLGLLVLWSGVLPVQAVVPDSTLNMPFRNTGLSFEERVNDLVGRLTLEEKNFTDATYGRGNRTFGNPGLQLVERVPAWGRTIGG